jgi:NAD dependent epimerase/dehydratase family enzyme
VLRIVRGPVEFDELHWNPDAGPLDPGALDGVDAVVNLCGVSIGGPAGRGRSSRACATAASTPPRCSPTRRPGRVPVLVNASAVGYYGDTRGRTVDETAPPGAGFLAWLCVDWESATATAHNAGVRVVLARSGLVLAPSGGVLGPLRPLFGLAWARGWAAADSTCRGSAWRTKCGR